MKGLVKALARSLFGDYAIYRVGRVRPGPRLPVPDGMRMVQITQSELEASAEPELRESAWYLGDEASAFACIEDGRVLALACCWWGGRYRARHSWPIGEFDAKLVHLVTLPAARGRGLAPLLIQHTEPALRAAGRKRLYARIWFSNQPSLRAFERAGWEPVGTLVEVNPLRLPAPWRLRLPIR